MFTDHYGRRFGPGRPPFGRGHWRGAYGPWQGKHGHRHGGWGRRRRPRLLPMLLMALAARAAWQNAQNRGRWGWGWDEGRSPRERGEWGGGPWGRHEHKHEHRHGQGRAAFLSLRSEIGPLAMLLRDAFRGGADERQLDEIRTVLGEARRRIGAILSEHQPPQTIV